LVLAVDASHAAMRRASWRAARAARRGGLPNAVFVAASLEALPPDLAGLGALVTVHFPWGSLLRAALGEDGEGARAIARLVAPGGRLRLLLSASERDAGRGATALEPGRVVAAYRGLGMRGHACRPASRADIRVSTWGKRLLMAGGDGRQAWLIELDRP
jgi:16S rRNA (adenine(1408)-N(1))-methyltransferase